MNSWVVFHDPMSLFVYVWNRSHTVNVYLLEDDDSHPFIDPMINVDVFSLYPSHAAALTYDQVYEACVQHFSEEYAAD